MKILSENLPTSPLVPTLEIDSNGNKSYFVNTSKGRMLHCENGPAYEQPDGYKAWYIKGELHREDGPAVERGTDHKAWYLNGRDYSFSEWLERTKRVNDDNKDLILKQLLFDIKGGWKSEARSLMNVLDSFRITWPELDVIRKYIK